MGAPHLVIAFIRESRDELKKVTWPNRQTTIRYTVVVVAVSLVVGLAIGGIDYFLQMALERIIK